MLDSFRKEKKDIIYKLSTLPGQSGAPLLLIDKDQSFKIIGIHKGGVTVKDMKEDMFNASRHITLELIRELRKKAK